MSKKNNVFPILGILFGAALIVCGVLFLNGKLAQLVGYGYGPTTADFGYTTFGADFYTYVSNNAYLAAQHARGTALYVKQVGVILKNFCGIFLIGFGALNICFFGTKLSFGKNTDKVVSTQNSATEETD